MARAMCGTDAAAYARDRTGMSAFALEDSVVSAKAVPIRSEVLLGWTKRYAVGIAFACATHRHWNCVSSAPHFATCDGSRGPFG
jgi:hypothetical protein